MPSKLFTPKRFTFSAVDKQALDPNSGCYDDISLWCKLYFDEEPLPWQHYFYHYRPTTCKDKLVVAGIRSGKSWVLTRGQLHFGFYHPYARLLNTSYSSEQAKIVWHNMMELIQMDRFKHHVEHVERSPYPYIRLVNGTEFWFRSLGYEGELLRGFEFDLIGLDEAALVTSKFAVDTLRGRLMGFNSHTGKPRAGIFWQVTSPRGKGTWVYDRWKRGDPRVYGADPDHYLSLRVRTMDNPKISPDQIRETMADYTDKMIEQEMMGEFVDDEGAEFNIDQVAYCCSESHKEVLDILEEIKRWKDKTGKKAGYREVFGVSDDLDYFELEPKAGHQYVASWDLGKKSLKNGRNATVGMVWDITELPWRLVAFRYEQNRSYLAALGWIEQWQMKYSSKGGDCHTVIDASGKGDVLNEVIEAENRIQVEGIVYSNTLKPNLITSGKLAIERDMVRFPPIRRMLDQFSIYTQADKDLPQDIVMSFCQAMHVAREMTGAMSTPTDRSNLGSNVYRRQPMMGGLSRRYIERRRASLHIRTGRVR